MADFKRLRYFNGQFLKENDFADEQTYLVQLERDHARLMHTPGIAEGLDVATPPSTAKTVSIPTGTAYDDLGRRIFLSTPFDPQLQAIGGGNVLYVTVKYGEAPSDPVTDTGTPGDTRVTEAPVVEVSETPPTPPATRTLLLARVTRNAAGFITEVNKTQVLRAGVKAGDLALNSLSVSGPLSVSGSVSSPTGTLAIANNMSVNGNITVTGTVDGRDVSADGGRIDTHLAATNNPHGTTAAQVNAVPTAGGAMTGNLQVNASLGINTAPGHRLHVVAADEADQQTVGAMIQASTTGASTATSGINVIADSTGAGSVTGIGVLAGNGSTGVTQGLNIVVNSGAAATGTGEKVGISVNVANLAATGTAPTKLIAGTATSSGTGPVTGLSMLATSNAAGAKVGIEAGATGTVGDKVAGSFTAATQGNVNALTRGLVVVGTSPSTTTGTGDVYGVHSTVSGTGAATKFAIYGNAVTGGGTRWAGYFDGNVHVVGTHSVTGTKTFRIDHPLDPLNKLLRHVAVESPEELCLYRGKVRLGADGAGVVELPEYFAALTKEEEATVQLTPIGRKPFLASYEWNHEHTAFTAFGEPNAEVSYTVLANRDDPAVRLVRRPVEEMKDEATRGSLLMPAAYPELGGTPGDTIGETNALFSLSPPVK